VLFSGCCAGWILRKKFWQASLMLPLSFCIGFTLKGAHLFHTDGRTSVWRAAYFYFRDYLHLYQGTGLGGFYVIGPYLSQKFGVSFTWLHSDWYQIFFETGLPGLGVVLLMYVDALYRSKRLISLFMALTAFGVFGVANMPLRYPLAGLYGAFLIRWALNKKAVDKLA
jgi:hypothetical protein